MVSEPHADLPIGGPHDRLVSTTAATDLSVTARHDPAAQVWGADLVGLGAALALTLEHATVIAAAGGSFQDDDASAEFVRFPPPVSVQAVYEVASPLPAIRLLTTPGVGPWAALRVTGERTLALVDDADFCSAVVLAAAAALPEGPVWEHAHELLDAVKKYGLSFAQAVG